MSRILALSIVALSSILMHSQTHASEGRVSELSPPVLDASRVSSYVGAPAREDASSQNQGKDVTKHTHASGKAIMGKTARTASLSSRSSYFYIYDAVSFLISDRDGDAYHSEFRLRFDADATFGDALVYAKLYLRRAGERDWWLYHTTDDFWIHGQSSDDDYFVTTALDDGFPTSEYDVLIDLYESGYSGIVATIGPSDSGGLSLLPLEETGLDVPVQISGYSIGAVSTTLIVDSDGDGHYSRYRITFDPDADVDSRLLYARVWVRARGGTWIEEHVSGDFTVDTSGNADAFSLTADWISGYPTAYYDVQIDLHDAATDLLVASAGSERPELSQIPLEDQSRDRYINTPSPGTGGDTTSRERGGGGALSIWSALALLLLIVARRTLQTKAAVSNIQSVPRRGPPPLRG